jgi:hypothetical protein
MWAIKSRMPALQADNAVLPSNGPDTNVMCVAYTLQHTIPSNQLKMNTGFYHITELLWFLRNSMA